MIPFSILLVVTLLQPQWVVGPHYGWPYYGPWPPTAQGMPGEPASFSGNFRVNLRSDGYGGYNADVYHNNGGGGGSGNGGGGGGGGGGGDVGGGWFTSVATRRTVVSYGDEDDNSEYTAARINMERAVEYASRMAAICAEIALRGNIRARDECYAKRDQAQRDRDIARDKFYAIRDRSRYGAPFTIVMTPSFHAQHYDNEDHDEDSEDSHDSQMESSSEEMLPKTDHDHDHEPDHNHEPDHDLEAEYAEAKDDLERAEEFAAQMTARCNKRFIQNNYNLKTKCYAERDRAISARDAAKEIFEAVKKRVESAAHAETTTSENLSQGSALQNLHNTQGQLNGVSTGSPSTFDSYTSDINNNNIDAINFNQMGDTYNLKLQIKKVNGICVEHWEVGLTRLADKMWEPAFDVKCKDSSGMRNRINRGNTLLVSNPDDSFCFFSTNPNSLSIIKDGTCIVYQYDNDGDKMGVSVLSAKNCDQEKKTMWSLLEKAQHNDNENGDDGGGSKDSHNTQMDSSSKEKPSKTGFEILPSTEEKQSFKNDCEESQTIDGAKLDSQPASVKQTINSNSVTNNGPQYGMRIQINRGGNNKIKIYRRNDDNGFSDEFKVHCASPNINCHVEAREALIGNPDEKFCAFAMLKSPETLIVIKNGKCKKRRYSGSYIFISTFKDNDCQYIKKSIRNISAKLKLRKNTDEKSKATINGEIGALQNELAKKLTEFTPESLKQLVAERTPETPEKVGTTSNVNQPGSSNSNAAQPSFLQRITSMIRGQ